MSTPFTHPTVFTANGDITKRWHVEYYYKHPETNKPIRFRVRNSTSYPTGFNRINNYEDRYKAAVELQIELTAKLQAGWNPFNDTLRPVNTTFNVHQALKTVVETKKGYLAKDSYSSLNYRIKGFQEWLKSVQKDHLHPSQITSFDIISYLNHISNKKKSVKPRTRNNHLLDIRGAFEFMKTIDKSWCPVNPCLDVPYVPSKSDRHEIWKPEKLISLSNYLKANDPNLYLFCLTFMMLGIRPKEAALIQLDQINLMDRTFLNRASNEKTGERKIKRIFTNLYDELYKLQLDQYAPSDYLFTVKGIPGKTPASREYFTKRFTKAKKRMKLTHHSTMYALKHTFIIELVKSGEPITTCMKISGHKTLQAFQSYVQQYLDTPPEEIKVDFSMKF